MNFDFKSYYRENAIRNQASAAWYYLVAIRYRDEGINDRATYYKGLSADYARFARNWIDWLEMV